MVNWKRVVWIAVFFYILYTAPTEGNAPITLDVFPRVSVTIPSKWVEVRVQQKIERHPDNRWRSLVWSDGLPLGSSGSAMKGEDEAATYEQFVKLYRGEYIFVACVVRVTGKKVKSHCVSQIVEVR